MKSLQQELARGWQIHQTQRYHEAEAIYRSVLSHAPKDPSSWCYLGIVLHDQRRYSEAVDAYRKAILFQPEFPIALNNLGNSLRYLKQFDEADACFQKAIDLKPDYLNAHKNRGTLHVWRGELDLGIKYYQQALKLNPNEAELHRNLGVIYLLQGRFPEGWAEYRWRWRVGDLKRPNVNAPIWDGSDLSGKSILLSAEQGLGDTLNFVRFAKLLRQRGANTTVYCQPQLLALLQQATDLGPIYPNNLQLDRVFDYQCSLLDVADLLQVTAAEIPSEPAYLKPADNLVSYWRPRIEPRGIAQEGAKRRIGIAWQGNPGHQADIYRSIPLTQFRQLSEIPGVELVSLQSGFGVEQLEEWSGPSIQKIDGQVDQTSGAFMDTAAIMQALDLVITSDTSIAHLAGAMGVPTWIALSAIPDWRWLLQGEASPWYPSVRLFRQTSHGQWDSVFSAMAERLMESA